MTCYRSSMSVFDIKQRWPNSWIRWAMLSIESYWTVDYSFGIFEFNVWSFGKERSFITLNLPVFPLGKIPKGDATFWQMGCFKLACNTTFLQTCLYIINNNFKMTWRGSMILGYWHCRGVLKDKLLSNPKRDVCRFSGLTVGILNYLRDVWSIQSVI